jgi:hypothetical protein
MIELEDGIYIAAEHVAMVKKVDDDKCLIFFVGQSAMEGFALPYAASEVAEAIDDSFCDDGDDDVEDDTEDE